MDGISQGCREGGLVVNVAMLIAMNVATVIAMAVNAPGRREVLDVDVVTKEEGPAGRPFYGLVARDLS